MDDVDDYVIEMRWPCTDPTCPQVNPGLALECLRCGRPKTVNNDVMPADTSERAAITDPKKLRRAYAGPAWKCRFCDLMAPAGEPCARCGAPSPGGEVVAAQPSRPSPPPRAPARPRRVLPPPMPIPGDGRDIFGFAPLPRVPRRDPRVKPDLLVLAVIVGMALLAFLVQRVTRTREVHAVVQAVSWTHTVIVDRWETHEGEGFEAPADAVHVRVVDPHRQNGTKTVFDHYAFVDDPNAPTDCGQTCIPVAPICKAKGNGTAGCKKQPDACTPKPCPTPKKVRVEVTREDPVYDPWLAWEVWGWAYDVREASARGTSTETRWPSPPTVETVGDQRLQTRNEAHYEVTFFGEGEMYPFTPGNEATFQRYPVGTQATLRVNLLGAEPLP